MQATIRPRTVKLIARILRPLTDEGIIYVKELNEILANLKSLSIRGVLMPTVEPKLIDQRQAAEMIGISYASFKAIERAGEFPFNRRMVGSSVRYRNTDILSFIMVTDDSARED